MNIIVPVKQVPESSKVKMDPETGTVIRTGVETVVNPLDLYAIETALHLKEQYGGKVTAITMGPPQAEKVLKEAEAMGCDDAILVSDKQFGGSDTFATSYILSEAIKKIGNADLIITGERATDGDTAQVGPGIAAHLDLPVASYVSKISDLKNKRLHLERLTEEGYEKLSVPLPCLITVIKEIGIPRLPTLKGKIRSRELAIPVYNTENLELKSENLGLTGSPTRVVKIESPRVTRGGKVLSAADEESLKTAVDSFFNLLEERGIL